MTSIRGMPRLNARFRLQLTTKYRVFIGTCAVFEGFDMCRPENSGFLAFPKEQNSSH